MPRVAFLLSSFCESPAATVTLTLTQTTPDNRKKVTLGQEHKSTSILQTLLCMCVSVCICVGVG